MADYAELYRRLFRATAKAIDLLQRAQQETEELYISAKPFPIPIKKSDAADAPLRKATDVQEKLGCRKTTRARFGAPASLVM